MTTGEIIKARRKSLGMNAETLAELCEVSPATIYRYEKGAIENMGIDKLLPIAKALRTTPAYLMGWTADPTDYDDPAISADIPKSVLDHFNGDVARAYNAMLAIDQDALEESKKLQDTFIDVEELPEDKRYLVEKVMSLSDAEVAGLRAIVDQVLAMREQ